MISIIICSRTADISKELRQNITATVGCAYELCIVDNSRNEYNIFTAYEEGTRRAKGDVLCFIHDDIIFHTDGWGTVLEKHIKQNPEVGAIGILGGHYLPQRPCYWLEPRKESANYIQGLSKNGQYYTRRIIHQLYRSERTYAAAIDGLFMAMPRRLFSERKVQWDTQTFHGFHFYDADMCMQVHKAGCEVEIIWDILIEHKSCSGFTEAFLEARKIWFQKWKKDLPITKGIEMKAEDIEICENIMDITDDSHAYYLLLRSKAYRLGKALLKPLKRVFDILNI